VGLAGLGVMGRNHLRHLSSRPDVALVAVADPDEASLQQAAGATGATGFSDAETMICDAPLDAVVVAAPTTSHATLVRAALERGLPVLVEKPLAASVEEGLELASEAERRGIPLQDGHIERFNPAVLELGRRLGDGWLGPIYSIASRRAGPYPARIRDVGVTIDLATHDADILCWIAGERPERVYAELARRGGAPHEDLLFGLLHFPSGATGMLDVNWLTPSKRRSLSVVGEAGMFELDYLTQQLVFTRSNLANPTVIRGYATTFEGDTAHIPVADHEPLAAELDAFIALARDGGRAIVNGTDGLWALAIATSLLEAAASATPVDMAPLAARIGAR
jgi:predicted dehydrogenase